MLVFMVFLHVSIALLLVVFILLQDSKGGAMGVFSSGGSSTSVFGGGGAGNVLVTVTKWLAIGFAITSVGLAYMTSQDTDSVLDAVNPGSGAPTEQEKVIDTTQPADTEAPATGSDNPESPEK